MKKYRIEEIFFPGDERGPGYTRYFLDRLDPDPQRKKYINIASIGNYDTKAEALEEMARRVQND